MAIFGYEIKKGSTFSDMKTEVSNIRKALKDYQLMRPDAENFRHTSDVDGVKIPVYYDGYRDYHRLDNLYNESDILRIIIQALKNKIFKRGIEIIPLVENPSESQKEILLKLLHTSNDNNQTMKDVLKMFEQNLDVTDDAYLIITKSYSFINGEIVNSEPKEIISAHPAYMRIISDAEGRRGYNDNGEKVYVDPLDRTILITETEAEGMNFTSKEGTKLLPAHYRGELGKDYGMMTNDNQSRYVYYIEGEVIHQSKWNPSLLYGFSNIHACWMKVATLLGQDRYFLLNYTKGRPPRALLTIGTTNFASAKKAWEELSEKIKQDPHGIHPMLIENDKGANPVQFIDFLKSPEEMQLIEFRNEARRSIGALWGVQPIFQGDLQGAGGLNVETVQIDITNISVQEGQEIYNDNIFPWVAKNWGITDWAFKLREPEEDDEMEEANMIGVKIDNATKMSSMGFEIEWDEKAKEFSFSEKSENPELLQNEPFVPFTNKAIDLADSRTLNKILTKVKKYAEISKKEIMKTGVVFDIKKQLDPTLLTLISKEIFDKVYENQTRQTSNKINNVILDGMSSKKSISAISKEIQNLGVKKGQADMIARTENAVLKNNIQEFNFTKAEGSENFLYFWAGPNDNRTSDISKEIKRKSAKGLKLETLKTLVRKTSIKFGFKPDRPWFSHFNQRHRFLKKV